MKDSAGAGKMKRRSRGHRFAVPADGDLIIGGSRKRKLTVLGGGETGGLIEAHGGARESNAVRIKKRCLALVVGYTGERRDNKD